MGLHRELLLLRSFVAGRRLTHLDNDNDIVQGQGQLDLKVQLLYPLFFPFLEYFLLYLVTFLPRAPALKIKKAT